MPEERILIYRLGSLGDTIIALPAFHAIRRSFPNAAITLLTSKPVASKAAPVESILAGTGLFDEVLNYPVGTRNPFVLGCLLWRIRSRNFSAAINLAEYRSDTATARDRFFFYLAGIRRFHGFNLEQRDKNIAPDPHTGQVEWEAARIVRRVESLILLDLADEALWDLRLSNEEIGEAEAWLSPLANTRNLVAFSTGTKVQAKHWGVEKWAELCGRLSRCFPGWSAVFFGSAEEAEEAEACMRAWNGRALNLCGVCSPRVTAAAMARCRFFIGHDSGPMHLAACMGLPCVAVFSARNLPQQWFPRGEGHEIVQHLTDCAGCGLETCVVEVKKCLSGIPVDEVERVAASLIGRLKANGLIQKCAES
jgi:ADP-heptose:LPS heptosyltransferase